MKKVVLNRCFGGFGLSEKAYEFLGPSWNEDRCLCECDRADPKLVECVETLGKDASDIYAKLEVVEYDDYNYTYEIYDHDGKENLVLIPIIHKSKIETMTGKEIIEYLTSLHICVVD